MRFLTLFFLLFTGQFLSAQSDPPSNADVRKATEALTVKYGLNADQAKQIYQIQERKNRNMAEIAHLQTKDLALYQMKWHNVQKGTWASIRRVLKSKQQVDTYNKTQAEIRGLRNARRKEMTAQKATKEAQELAVLAIYAE